MKPCFLHFLSKHRSKCRHNASVFVITVFGFARLPPLVLLSCTDCAVSISFLESTTTKVASYLRNLGPRRISALVERNFWAKMPHIPDGTIGNGWVPTEK